jgi:hypothetical protein
MSSETRTVVVGRKNYTIVTPLDEERFTEVVGLIRAVLKETNERFGQEERLFLSCLLLANRLVETRCRLEAILEAETVEEGADEGGAPEGVAP